MSKKKKGDFSYWDIDDQDQESMADAFFEFEQGSNNEIPQPPSEKDGFSELESLIQEDLLGSSNDTDQEDDPEILVNYNWEDDLDDDEDDDEISPEYVIPISFMTFPDLKRVTIEDSFAPTAFCYDSKFIMDTIINYDGYNDMNTTLDLIGKLTEYILVLKHPTAVYTHEEFYEKFKNVKSFSDVDFCFFKNDKYVFAYYVDPEDIGVMNEKVAELCDSYSDLLAFYISLAYACGRQDQVFYGDDDSYVLKYKTHIADNNEEFTKLFLMQEQTVITRDPEGFDYLCGIMNICDVKDVLQTGHGIIMKIADLNYDDPDEVDDDIEEDLDEDDSVEVKKEPSVTTESKPEEVQPKTIKPEEPSEALVADLDDDMEIDVDDEPEEDETVEKEPPKKVEEKVIRPVNPTSINEEDPMILPVLRKKG